MVLHYAYLGFNQIVNLYYPVLGRKTDPIHSYDPVQKRKVSLLILISKGPFFSSSYQTRFWRPIIRVAAMVPHTDDSTTRTLIKSACNFVCPLPSGTTYYNNQPESYKYRTSNIDHRWRRRFFHINHKNKRTRKKTKGLRVHVNSFVSLAPYKCNLYLLIYIHVLSATQFKGINNSL